MRIINYIFFLLILTNCKNSDSKKTIGQNDTIMEFHNISASDTSFRIAVNPHSDYVFNDSLFSFLNVDSLSGSFLRDRIVNTFFYNFKSWNGKHFDFFKTKPNYYDFGCYLIAKQLNIDSNLICVIDLRCPPLEGATGYLYTITKDLMIVDSIEVVSNWISGNEGNEFYYKGETNSKFNKNLIDIEKISYTCKWDDSCYMDRKETLIARILSSGKIDIMRRTDEKMVV